MSSLNYDEPSALGFDDINAIVFFQNKYTLHKMQSKSDNNHGMKIYIGTKMLWKCTRKACKVTRDIRSYTSFQNSKTPFLKVIKFIYWWSKDLTSIHFFTDELEIGKFTAVDWNNYLREVCTIVVKY